MDKYKEQLIVDLINAAEQMWCAANAITAPVVHGILTPPSKRKIDNLEYKQRVFEGILNEYKELKEAGDPIPEPETLENHVTYGKKMYMKGWNDREGDLLCGIDRIYPKE